MSSQKQALRLLNARVVNQRAVLRRLNEMGVVLSDEDWKAIRESRPELDEENPMAQAWALLKA